MTLNGTWYPQFPNPKHKEARGPRARASLFATEKYTYTFVNWSGLDLEIMFLGFREFKIHEYSKRQTLDSSWEFLKK